MSSIAKIFEKTDFLEKGLKRLWTSEFLLIALAKGRMWDIEEVRKRLVKWLEVTNKTSNEFFFDLGYGKSLESVLHDLYGIFWLDRTDPHGGPEDRIEAKYQANVLGLKFLETYKKKVEKYLGVSLEELELIR